MSPQARGSAGGRRRHDATSQEDHDKPYVCDSKYGQTPPSCPVPVPLPCAALAASTPQAHWLLFSGLAPPAGMPAPHLLPVPPLLWPRGLLHEGEASQEGLPTFEALLLPQAVPSFMPFLWLFFFHSVFLRFILYFFLYFRVTNKSITQNPPTKALGSMAFRLFLSDFLLSLFSPVLGRASYESFSDNDLV